MAQPDYRVLVGHAMTAAQRAYVPYSRFPVGAAVLTAAGHIFLGCNIENAAYPAGVCAERTALFSAYVAGEREIVALAVVTDTPEVASPCGICRQVMWELASDAVIVLANFQEQIEETTVSALLPHGFRLPVS